ncbi:MAG: peptidylprolyl isomerase [Alphaproteobacteria bacterium]|nr:peptidylprolyl isomerase [Alphaproteobacteria bacterium]HPF46782.1 peptidylprolyl isomerase [Emcibacteraceae bacterium]HRW30512.1 peptidylprolyl isomerase [Emcibacteraceae bacterium]
MLRKFLMLSLFAMFASSAVAENVKVKLETTMGDIHIELYADKAPITVANFLRYIDGGYFDGGAFYRVVRMDNQQQNRIKIEVIQGGMSGDSNIGEFPPIKLERTIKTGIKHEDGTISMARDTPDSASSEFFICINDQPSLDYGGMRNPDGQGFAAFGKVTEGMDVVRAIQQVKTIPPQDPKEFTGGQKVMDPVIFKSFHRE